MRILGLQGSPREGNTHCLLHSALGVAREMGAVTRVLEPAKLNISYCRGCGFCEKKGRCVIEGDDMTEVFFPALREADVVFAASPIFFYNTPAQMKALIDRSQSLWARKYVFRLLDPFSQRRKGILLGVGATKGANLFEGLELTFKYFFDAAGVSYDGKLVYRKIEGPGDMAKHPGMQKDVRDVVTKLLTSFTGRKKILFVCPSNDSFSQMAQAFAARDAGDRVESFSCGMEPSGQLNPEMVLVMEEKGVDMAYRMPKGISELPEGGTFDQVVWIGCPKKNLSIPGAANSVEWEMPPSEGASIEQMRKFRDEMEERVEGLINRL